ncbi:MAG: hypothetical protein JOY90_31540 [Bradyrhizobium sp.]|uniref:hypothetical protein n=1 Tax=Bradyrhizobium sp. TaxID=376 RepID=UPI001DE5A998|nr:hypothetical protein [Bradyrhizobium sp.]MBV9564946.1 hypothetical protein [Bradyrhizobium sp.]
MSLSVEALWKLPEVELIASYHEARRRFVEAKFARDTQRARLEWLKAKAFTTATGGVTERRTAVDVSEELARKGQELREMTRDLDLLKVDVDVHAIVIRQRSGHAPGEAEAETDGEERAPDGT